MSLTTREWLQIVLGVGTGLIVWGGVMAVKGVDTKVVESFLSFGFLTWFVAITSLQYSRG